MMIPTDSPGAARTAAVAQKREREGGAAEPAEFIRHARRGSDAPARARRARRGIRLVAEQKTEPAAVARRKREPPRCGEVRRRRKLRHHGRERAASQGLFHREQRIDRARDVRDQETAWCRARTGRARGRKARRSRACRNRSRSRASACPVHARAPRAQWRSRLRRTGRAPCSARAGRRIPDLRQGRHRSRRCRAPACAPARAALRSWQWRGAGAKGVAPSTRQGA